MTNDYSPRKIACQQAINTLVIMVKCIDHVANGTTIGSLILNNSNGNLSEIQAHYLELKEKLPDLFSKM